MMRGRNFLHWLLIYRCAILNTLIYSFSTGNCAPEWELDLGQEKSAGYQDMFAKELCMPNAYFCLLIS